jgi:hypothetical protein
MQRPVVPFPGRPVVTKLDGFAQLNALGIQACRQLLEPAGELDQFFPLM